MHLRPTPRLAVRICLFWASFATCGAAVLPDYAALQSRLADRSRALTWVVTGDSITQGAKWLGTSRSYPELLSERVRWEMGRLRDLVIDSGVSGEVASGLLDDFEWRVLRFKPDIVSIMIGTNDSRFGPAGRDKFRSNLVEIVRRVRAAGAIPILHTTSPIDFDAPAGKLRSDLPAYDLIIAEVASREGVILVDHWGIWRKTVPEANALRRLLADPVHPNAAGHRKLAVETFRALGIYSESSVICRESAP